MGIECLDFWYFDRHKFCTFFHVRVIEICTPEVHNGVAKERMEKDIVTAGFYYLSVI